MRWKAGIAAIHGKKAAAARSAVPKVAPIVARSVGPYSVRSFAAPVAFYLPNSWGPSQSGAEAKLVCKRLERHQRVPR